MAKKKVEIINISLDVDLEKEIKSKVDALNSDLMEHTVDIIKKKGVKIQRTSKKRQNKQAVENRVKQVIDLLLASEKTPDLWVSGPEMVSATDLEFTSQNLNKLAMQVRKVLRDEGKWELSKKRRMGQSVYRLIRFS